MGLLDTGKKCNKTKGEVNKSTITFDKFNTLLPINDRNGQKKKSARVQKTQTAQQSVSYLEDTPPNDNQIHCFFQGHMKHLPRNTILLVTNQNKFKIIRII